MSPISDSMRKQLDQLSQRIQEVEQILKRMPGSMEATIETGEVEWPHLEYYGGRIVVCDYQGGDDPDRKILAELPIQARVEFSKLIPELLDDALRREAEVSEIVNEVIGSIDDAITKHS